MKPGLRKEIKENVVAELINRCFSAQEYAAYVFSTEKSEDGYYLLIPEESDATNGLKTKDDWPIPRQLDDEFKGLRVSPKNYQKYFNSRGGYRFSFQTIVKDHCDHYNGGRFLAPERETYWNQQLVIFCGYELKDEPLIIFLVFDMGKMKTREDNNKTVPEETPENDLIWINIHNVLKKVEDVIHVRHIFPEISLDAIDERIRLDELEKVNDSIVSLTRAPGSSNYLRKLYYDFFIDNMVLYPQLSLDNQETLMSLNREFEKYQKHLFRGEKYRDHFLHQIYVFLLGLSVLDIIQQDFEQDLVGHFNRAYKDIQPGEYKTLNDIFLLWFLTSMFHDIAYPVELCEEWVAEAIRLFLTPGHNGKDDLGISLKFLKLEDNNVYLKGIDKLAELIKHLHFPAGEKNGDRPGIAGQLERQFEAREHGVISAFMVLHSLQEQTGLHGFLFPAVEAISLHQLWMPEDSLPCISFEKDPAGFLLILCDLLHDWGRYNYEKIDQVSNFALNPCQLTAIRNNDKTAVFDIEVKTPAHEEEEYMLQGLIKIKTKQIEKTFERLCFLPGYDIVIRLLREGEVLFEIPLSSCR